MRLHEVTVELLIRGKVLAGCILHLPAFLFFPPLLRRWRYVSGQRHQKRTAEFERHNTGTKWKVTLWQAGPYSTHWAGWEG